MVYCPKLTKEIDPIKTVKIPYEYLVKFGTKEMIKYKKLSEI